VNSFYVKEDDLYSVRLEWADEKGVRTCGIYNDTDGTWLIEPLGLEDRTAHHYLSPTNDPNIWYDGGTDLLYNVEERKICSPGEFAIYGRKLGSFGPLGVNYPGVQYAYWGHREK
jgi:hypothetical protein